MANYIFIFDGIGTTEERTSNVIDYAAFALEDSLADNGLDATVEWVKWPAMMAGIGHLSWAESTRVAINNFNDRLDKLGADDKFVILAFSGGNRPVHEWLEITAERRPDMLDRVLAVGFASDPYRPYGKQQHGMPMPGGWGISGQEEGPIPDRSFWVAVPGDVITDARHDSILRTAADVSDYFPARVVRGLVKYVNSGNLQLAWQIKAFRENPLRWFMGLNNRLGQARDDIVGYMTGAHTTDYAEPFDGGESPMVRFGRSISWKVRSQ